MADGHAPGEPRDDAAASDDVASCSKQGANRAASSGLTLPLRRPLDAHRPGALRSQVSLTLETNLTANDSGADLGHEHCPSLSKWFEEQRQQHERLMRTMKDWNERHERALGQLLLVQQHHTVSIPKPAGFGRLGQAFSPGLGGGSESTPGFNSGPKVRCNSHEKAADTSPGSEARSGRYASPFVWQNGGEELRESPEGEPESSRKMQRATSFTSQCSPTSPMSQMSRALSSSSLSSPRRKLKKSPTVGTLFTTGSDFDKYETSRRKFASRVSERHSASLDSQHSASPQFCFTPVAEPKSPSEIGYVRGVMRSTVEHPWFSYALSLIIILNALLIGVQIEWNVHFDSLPAFVVLSHTFTVIFTMEWCFRIVAYGWDFVFTREWGWNLMDTLIVFTSALDMIVDLSVQDSGEDGSSLRQMSVIRMARVMRMFRVVRVLRVLRVFRPLRLLITAICGTLKSCAFTLIMLFLFMYMFATLFTQGCYDFIQEETSFSVPPEMMHLLKKYYGTFFRSLYTLFTTLNGGISWGEVVEPLAWVGWAYVALFMIYVFFVHFAVLNVVTGIFCQSAIESAVTEKEEVLEAQLSLKESYVARFKELFTDMDTDETGFVTLDEFEQMLGHEDMSAYFETLDLTMDNAWTLFKLLDKEERGYIKAEEFVEGCLRLRGQARAIDLNKMMYENRWIRNKLGRFMRYVESELSHARRHREHLAERAYLTSPTIQLVPPPYDYAGDAVKRSPTPNGAEAFVKPPSPLLVLEAPASRKCTEDGDASKTSSPRARSPQRSRTRLGRSVGVDSCMQEPVVKQERSALEETDVMTTTQFSKFNLDNSPAVETATSGGAANSASLVQSDKLNLLPVHNLLLPGFRVKKYS
eukprot:TRINITY_DN27774_c0_g2_i1.p1 TRINITY_DN27774_c0_g2~~TRINITY_DN27774_c0_g2_i1.p1  ORF type:complete len:869 (+),score=111.53 TRINITY_DN27774_c0_g2_i1:147-2753(+)